MGEGREDEWILVRAIGGLGKRIAHLWHDLSEKVEVERVVALLDAFCGATRRVRQFTARGEVHERPTHSPALALNETFVGWRSSWRVFSWMSGRFIVTYSTFCDAPVSLTRPRSRGGGARAYAPLSRPSPTSAGPRGPRDVMLKTSSLWASSGRVRDGEIAFQRGRRERSGRCERRMNRGNADVARAALFFGRGARRSAPFVLRVACARQSCCEYGAGEVFDGC